MFKYPTHAFLLLEIFIILHGIYLTSCHIVFSDQNHTVKQNIAELNEFEEYFGSLSPEAQVEYILHMKNFDEDRQKIMMEQLRLQSSSATQSENMENATELESNRIKPFRIEDYPFSEKEYIDSANDINTNGTEDKVRFYLHTKKNPSNPDELFLGNIDAVGNSSFIRNAPVKVLIQGFDSTLQSDIFPAILNASYLNPQTRDLNTILIDWSILGAGPNYIVAVHNLQVAAEQIANFVKFLVDKGVTTLDQVHIVGHSMGCHLAGQTGFYVNQLMGQKVPRITGLDPILPFFALTDERGRIDPSDANFVDIIHTSGLQIGLLRSFGHADFYVNGGVSQPACSDDLLFRNFGAIEQVFCIHNIAHNYFSESILYPTGFKACKCNENILNGFSSCDCNGTDSTAYMGEYLSTSATGIYYLETNDKPLYGKGSVNEVQPASSVFNGLTNVN